MIFDLKFTLWEINTEHRMVKQMMIVFENKYLKYNVCKFKLHLSYNECLLLNLMHWQESNFGLHQ